MQYIYYNTPSLSGYHITWRCILVMSYSKQFIEYYG